MHCCVPFCKNTADNAAGSDELTFHSFPSDAILRMKWLRALGKLHCNQPLKDSAVVCSEHFLEDEFCEVEGGLRQVRSGVIPSALKLCMICLETDRNVIPLSKYNLEEAYEKLTEHSIYQEGYLKPTICMECAQRLINFKNFKSKSLRARSAMMDLVKMHETITMQHITQIKNMREQLQSNIVKTLIAPDHCDLYIKDNNYEDTQTDTTAPANDAIKVEETNAMWVDIKIEKEDPVEYDGDNVSEANIMMDIKLENIKVECPVCYKVFPNEDAYNAHHERRHGECGSEERDTQLAHRTHTALHSQHRVTNQVWDGAFSDYPHTSGSDTNSEYESCAPESSTKKKLNTEIVHKKCVTKYSREDLNPRETQPTDAESRRLKKRPKTSAERAREFRARKALLKQQQEPEEDNQVPGPSEIRIIEKRAKSAESTRRWREKKKPLEEKKQAKSAAQRMREYRARKKL